MCVNCLFLCLVGGGAGYVQIQLFKETAVMQAWCNFFCIYSLTQGIMALVLGVVNGSYAVRSSR